MLNPMPIPEINPDDKLPYHPGWKEVLLRSVLGFTMNVIIFGAAVNPHLIKTGFPNMPLFQP
jgi:hypothetical protein